MLHVLCIKSVENNKKFAEEKKISFAKPKYRLYIDFSFHNSLLNFKTSKLLSTCFYIVILVYIDMDVLVQFIRH